MSFLEPYQPENKTRMNVESFEAFKSRLRVLPATTVREQLEARMEYHCFNLLASMLHEQDSPEKRYAAERGLAMTAMALTTDSSVKSLVRRRPPWLETARDGIANFVAADRNFRGILLETVFFEASDDDLRRLDTAVSAAIEPAGSYDDQAFAAGVAIGAIKAA